MTVALIAEHGHAATSLARIAEAAEISKAAVLYHFSTKNAVVEAAYRAVLDALVGRVAAAVEAAPGPGAAVEAYVTAMIGHLAEHPGHGRVISEALRQGERIGVTDAPTSEARWRPLADLVSRAQEAGEYRADIDPRTFALVINGAIDAVVAESLEDPAYTLTTAAPQVVDLLSHAARP
ncbi:TetR/AcrR family transcriptional regulator; helix-turn-helix transcriptional regulator [Streptomonospora sp. S1-112]|uniref:TetR/AcrR family transcriptional regulator helix-turn-helix transcriptional regulator n=1 Tax=Streptomonospora mangrovi TaxID=2883123 RepID=A0A9X3NJ02_9ACTN|nr:TetR family transcriptional regulator [Streptomonospora mangrovi]MDA0564098.1 TetR/AcrR family transcriptional regulator; helix-turn-helix transcriptional regulator [Streptomonospora mangrovi]